MPDLLRPTDAAPVPTPAPAPAPSPTVVITDELTWLQKHERLIIVVLVLALGGWLGNKWMNVSAENAKSALVVQQAASTAAASQASEAAKTYQAAIDALSKENVALAASQQARNTVLVKQQTQTATQAASAPNEFVKTWQTLIPGIMPGTIAQQSVVLPDKSTSQQFVVDLGPAVETVNKLESVPVLQANLADETALAGNTQTTLNTCSTALAAQKNSNVEDKKTCDAQVASLKADARKSKRNWFIGGLVTAGTIAIMIAVHGL